MVHLRSLIGRISKSDPDRPAAGLTRGHGDDSVRRAVSRPAGRAGCKLRVHAPQCWGSLALIGALHVHSGARVDSRTCRRPCSLSEGVERPLGVRRADAETRSPGLDRREGVPGTRRLSLHRGASTTSSPFQLVVFDLLCGGLQVGHTSVSANHAKPSGAPPGSSAVRSSPPGPNPEGRLTDRRVELECRASAPGRLGWGTALGCSAGSAIPGGP